MSKNTLIESRENLSQNRMAMKQEDLTRINYKWFAMLYRSELGWSVVPFAGTTLVKDWHGYQNALPSVEDVESWWDEYPDANPVVVVGCASNLIVLEVIEPYFLESQELIIPDTATITGGEKHLFYFFKRPSQDGDILINYSGDGFNIFCKDGYVPLPPSTEPETGLFYKWGEGHQPWKAGLSDPSKWMLDLCTESPQHKSRNKRKELLFPKPLGEEAYCGITGDIIRLIEPHTEADPVSLLTSFHAAYGNVIGDRAHFYVEADRHSMRLFYVQVGESSKARKGVSWRHVERLFKNIDPEWVENRIKSGLSSGEGLIWAVRDPIVRTQPVKKNGSIIGYNEVVDDEGVPDKRLLVFEGEFASTLKVLGRTGNTLSPVIRNAWDTGNLQSLTKNSPANATGAHISIIGHITREELLRGLPDTELLNGFANRFLWFSVKRSKSLPFGGGIHDRELEPFIDKLKQSVEFARKVERVGWAPETRPLWEKVYPELSEANVGRIGALTARAEAYVTRISCIYALLDCSTVIKAEHLRAALAIWRYAEASVRYIFHDEIGDNLAKRILGFISTSPEGLSRTEISTLLYRSVESSKITEALELLESLGWIDRNPVSTDGRPKEVWTLNN